MKKFIIIYADKGLTDGYIMAGRFVVEHSGAVTFYDDEGHIIRALGAGTWADVHIER